MSALPANVTYEQYWSEIYARPLDFWQPLLRQIADTERFADQAWTRARLGRNVVFLSEALVIKLGPPCWQGDIAREAITLSFIKDKLPVSTPTALAVGIVDGWEYLVQQRLPGTNLHELWLGLDQQTQTRLAVEHGRLMAALHRLAAECAPQELHQFDWQLMLAEQFEQCEAAMQRSGVAPALAARARDYLPDVQELLSEGQDPVVLHGDLGHLNLLVETGSQGWTITGLIDWGDLKIGPRSHEFISPGVHMYRGNCQALHGWYSGYGLAVGPAQAPLQHKIMARAMLYYCDELAGYIQTVEGAAACSDWESLANAFWKLTE